jgi:hypothetical protein
VTPTCGAAAIEASESRQTLTLSQYLIYVGQFVLHGEMSSLKRDEMISACGRALHEDVQNQIANPLASHITPSVKTDYIYETS